jgi:cobalt-precorrin-5B (C1)-methyltransferase
VKRLERGYTTGACAAAAARGAAVMLKKSRPIEEVSILLPGQRKTTPFRIDNPRILRGRASCSVRKNAGDDPDVTDGLDIFSEVRVNGTGDITVLGGRGVGRVTKPGLQVEVGRPAINPVPLRMIREAVKDLFPDGVTVTISVPGGEEIAKKTFNPKLGIVGGISIIGTTGIVRPFSVSALKTSILLEIGVLHASGAGEVFLVPGNIGRRAVAKNYGGCPSERIVMISNFLGDALGEAAPLFRRVFLVGHPGKLLKVLNGDYDTHSRRSPPALPLVVGRMKERGIGLSGGDLKNIPTVEGVMKRLDGGTRLRLFGEFARDVEERVASDLGVEGRVAVALVDMEGNVVGRGDLMRSWEHAPCPR